MTQTWVAPEAPAVSAPAHGLSRPVALLLVALLCVPYLVGLGDPPLWDANEPLYAEPPREALESGEWLAPPCNYRTWFAHPPLSTWLTIPFYSAFGVSPFSERLPMAFAAIATIFAVYSLGATISGRRVGVLGALALASTARFWLFSRQLAGDVYLTTCLVGAFALAAPALLGRPEGRRRLLFAHALASVGVLAKGPFIALPLYCVPLLLAARLGRPALPLRSLRIGAGLLLAVAIGAPWFVYMSWRYDDFARTYIGWHNFRRAFSDEVTSARGWWFPMQAIIGEGQPWILLLPFAFARAFGLAPWAPGPSQPASQSAGIASRARSFLGRVALALRQSERAPLVVLAFAGVLFPLFFFSIPLGKRTVYLLPVYPMLAVAIAPFIAELVDGLHRRLTFSVALLATLACGSGIWMLLRARGSAPDDLVLASTPFLVALFAGVLVFGYAAARQRGRVLAFALAGFPLGAVCLASALLPVFGRYMPVPRLAQTLVKYARPGDVAIVYGVSIQSLTFYARRQTETAANPLELLAKIPPGSRAFVLGQDDEIAEVAKNVALRLVEIDRAPYFQLQFRRNVLGQGRSTRDLVLVTAERIEPAGDGGGAGGGAEEPARRER